MQRWSSGIPVHERATPTSPTGCGFVISGSWFVNSGKNFESEATVTRGWLLCCALRTRHTLTE